MRYIDNEAEWDVFVRKNNGHPLQLSGWGNVKAAHGWKVERYLSEDGTWGVQVLLKPLPRPFHSLAYAPRGPVGKWEDNPEITELAALLRKKHKATLLTIEPHAMESLNGTTWRKTSNTILLPRTLILDLTRSEDDLQDEMTKKTRQYIRKSAAAVHVKRIGTEREVRECLDVYHQTAHRAGFSLHGDDYYVDITERFREGTAIFGAYEGKTLVAFLWLAVSDTIAFELYGGVTNRGQELRANYILKWAAIQNMKQHGIKEYDFNGLLNDGISTFKQSFARHETQLAGSYDLPLSMWYRAWRYGLPLAKKIFRLLKRT